MFADNFTRAILRTVIDHDNFKVVIVGIQQAANGRLDDPLFVKGGHDYRNERLLLFPRGVPGSASWTPPFRKSPRPRHTQASQSPHPAKYKNPQQKPAPGRN